MKLKEVQEDCVVIPRPALDFDTVFIVIPAHVPNTIKQFLFNITENTLEYP